MINGGLASFLRTCFFNAVTVTGPWQAASASSACSLFLISAFLPWILANAALAACQGPVTVTALKKQVRKKEAKPPLITSTLQQEASTKLSFSAKKTMQVAQKLYEGVELEDHSEGLITYMRTDSTRLSNVFIEAAHDFIVGHFGKEYSG